jgi:hypothetical protein
MKLRFLFVLSLLFVAMLPGVAFGNAVYNVSIDTSPLIGNAAGPFMLDFQFLDGSGLDDGNNTVTLSGFAFGSGSPTGSASTFGGVAGDLLTSLTLTDTSFFNEFTQGFTPGNALAFVVDLTTNVDLGGVPDEFTLAILDSSGFQIPTLGPFDTVLLADITSGNPSLFSYGSDTSRNAVASGEPIALAAPSVSQVPEPSLGWLVAGGFFALLICARFRSIGSKRA